MDEDTHCHVEGLWDEKRYWSEALFQASRQGQLERARQLMRNESVDLEYADAHGNTPLLTAAFHGHEAIVRLLLIAGADPETRNEAGKSALALARFTQPMSLVQLLTEPPQSRLWHVANLGRVIIRLMVWRRRAFERLYKPVTGAGYATAQANFSAVVAKFGEARFTQYRGPRP